MNACNRRAAWAALVLAVATTPALARQAEAAPTGAAALEAAALKAAVPEPTDTVPPAPEPEARQWPEPEPLHTDPRHLQPMDVFALEWADAPAVSPDGRSIAYLRRGFDRMADRGRSDLWLLSADGRRHRPLT